jgi:phage-related protein
MRVIHLAWLPQAEFVLHAFQKTPGVKARQDIEIARTRYAELKRDRR